MNENIENKILLRSTGELPPDEIAALDAVLASDAEAAEFACFVAEKLPARAPRDFAAAAIHEALPERNVIAFPRIWKLTAAAAAVVAAALGARYFTPDAPPAPLAVTQPAARVTVDISTHLDALEADIATSRQRLARGRYSRQPDIL